MRRILILPVLAAMLFGLLSPAPAQAATVSNWLYSAATGATYSRVLDRVVQSDLTSRSAVAGYESATDKRSLVSASAAGLLTLGAVETSTTATAGTGGAGNLSLRSFARTASVDLLGGLVRVDALTTDVTTTAKPDGSVAATGGTTLAGIRILGLQLPLTIPRNFSVGIPGIATITANVLISGGGAEGASTQGWALGITLLSARDGFAAGTTIMVNPFFQGLQAASPLPQGKRVGGEAYSTRIGANVANLITIDSSPTAYIAAPLFGSDNKTLTNTTATVSVPGIATLSALTSTSTSRTSATGGVVEVISTNQTAGLDLLGGLIKADAIKVRASGRVENGVYTGALTMDLLKLTVAGQVIPISVAPNTTIDVLGLGKVEINKQEKFDLGQLNKITALKITLDTARVGLPVGAVVEIGVASTIIEK